MYNPTMNKIDFEWDDNKSKTNIKNQYAPQYNCGASEGFLV